MPRRNEIVIYWNNVCGEIRVRGVRTFEFTRRFVLKTLFFVKHMICCYRKLVYDEIAYDESCAWNWKCE